MSPNELDPARPVTSSSTDLYRHIHKATRAELFNVTATAGRTDPADRRQRANLASHVGRTLDLVADQVRLEEALVQPVLERELPALAERIAADHEAIDVQIGALRDLTVTVDFQTGTRSTCLVHALHLELASFSSADLDHLDFEERVVMPALERAIGLEAVLELRQQILGCVSRARRATTLAVMIPALNIDDLTDLVLHLQTTASGDMVAGVWGLMSTLLHPSVIEALAARLGID